MAALKPFFKTKEQPFAKGGSGRAGKRNIGVGGCEACKLYQQCTTPKMEATGEGAKGILVIAEAPGAEEDRRGEQLIGKSGQRLRDELARVGIDLDKDCRKINAVNCRPPKNKTPTDAQVGYCRHRVMAEIEAFKPKVILALGGPAVRSLCQHRGEWGKRGFPPIGNWQGEVIPDQELGAWIIPTWHPAFMERLSGNTGRKSQTPIYERKWRQDLANVAIMAEEDPPELIDFASMVEVIVSPAIAAKRLEELYTYLRTEKDPFIVFDYETTGRKPYVDGHKIVCCSFCWDYDKSISFLLTDDTWPWVEKILRNPKFRKCAHNMQYEELWTRVRGWPAKGGFAVRNWAWDSMLAAFVLDNRPGKSGLKHLTYVRLGVLGYDMSTSHYLKSKDEHANAFNRVMEAPIRDLLLYCGMDTLCAYNLAMEQQEAIANDEGLTEAYDLWHNGALALVDAEINGIRTDRDYCEAQTKHLDRRIAHLKKRMLDYDEIKRWQAMCKHEGLEFNLNSKQQMQKLLFDPEYMGLPIKKKTDSGAASVDKSVLEDLQLPFAKDMVLINKLAKLRGTYLKGFLNESPGGIMHPFYNLNTVVSYRGSCDSPSFQNIPKRDSESQKITRRALYPHLGHLWLEIDYSSIEVRIAATYHKDPNMIRYLTDPHSDMHRDMAMQLMYMPEDLVSKYLRNAAKNGFVFAQFYGDWFEACATNMWEKWFNTPDAKLANGVHIYDHLKANGIKTLKKFIDHVEDVENHFWNKRFPVYGEWREDNWQEYRRTGEMRAHTGFRYTAIMDNKQTSNYGTQGCGFHCLLWSLTQANRRLKREQWRSMITGQIHDAIEGSAAPEEINELLPMMRSIMIDDLVKRFDWINVPMDVEFELSPLGKSWYELKQVFHREQPCKCGLEWGYSKKQDDGSVRWECPVCEHFDVVRK